MKRMNPAGRWSGTHWLAGLFLLAMAPLAFSRDYYDGPCTNCTEWDNYVKDCVPSYDPATEGCCNDDAYTLATEGCCNSVVYDLATEGCCGSNVYDLATQGCCGDSVYDLATQGCCGTNIYELATEGCCNGTVYDLVTEGCCGTNVYDLATQKCCGDNIYDPDTQGCCTKPDGSKEVTSNPENANMDDVAVADGGCIPGAFGVTFCYNGKPETAFCPLSQGFSQAVRDCIQRHEDEHAEDPNLQCQDCNTGGDDGMTGEQKTNSECNAYTEMDTCITSVDANEPGWREVIESAVQGRQENCP